MGQTVALSHGTRTTGTCRGSTPAPHDQISRISGSDDHRPRSPATRLGSGVPCVPEPSTNASPILRAVDRAGFPPNSRSRVCPRLVGLRAWPFDGPPTASMVYRLLPRVPASGPSIEEAEHDEVTRWVSCWGG